MRRCAGRAPGADPVGPGLPPHRLGRARRAAGHGAAAYLTSLGASGPLLQEIQGQDVEQEVPDTAEKMRSLNDQLGDHGAEPEPGPSPAGSRWRDGMK